MSATLSGKVTKKKPTGKAKAEPAASYYLGSAVFGRLDGPQQGLHRTCVQFVFHKPRQAPFNTDVLEATTRAELPDDERQDWTLMAMFVNRVDKASYEAAAKRCQSGKKVLQVGKDRNVFISDD
jgi:hypothetical protein